jgi:hypothetical protein
MYEEINRQMEEAMQQIYRKKKISIMLEELRKRKQELEEKKDQCQLLLDKENADLDKLEGGLTHLFYTVIGKLGEQEEKERKEALAAKLKYDQAIDELTQLSGQIRQLEEESIQYRSCQRDYDSLYEKKKQLLMEAGTETASQILELQQQITMAENNLKEIREAISAGNRVSSSVKSALSSLESAEGWGTWDLLGGGLISDMAKHSHIDDAKLAADRIQSELSHFRAELADVRISNDIHFEMDGFGKFADFFFDGLIADWCMQSRIEESLGSVRNVENQVNEALRRLKDMERSEALRITEIGNRVNGLIQNS